MGYGGPGGQSSSSRRDAEPVYMRVQEGQTQLNRSLFPISFLSLKQLSFAKWIFKGNNIGINCTSVYIFFYKFIVDNIYQLNS